MDRLFRQSALFRPKWDVAHHAGGATYGEETLTRAIERTEDVYSPEIGPRIFEHEGRYFRAKAENISSISNFVCVPQEMVMSDEDVQMTADMVTTRGETFRLTFMTTDFTSLPKFKNVLNKRTISLNFTGNEADVELLKGYLASLQWTTKRGVRALGIYAHDGRWVFVSPDGAIDSDGKPVDDVVQLERFKNIDTKIHRCEAIDAAGLKALGPPLLKYNEPAKTVGMLAWTAGCFIKEHLRQANIKYPHLNLIGEAGGGKSTSLERTILPVFSRTKIIAAPQITGFTLMMEGASSNIIPQALDEFKPSKIDKFRLQALYNHMRDAYDGHTGQRGRGDQSVNNYMLVAPLIIAGEESPDETAIRERSIELRFAKLDLTPECKAAFDQLAQMPDTLAAFGRGLLDTALVTPKKEVVAWYNAALPLFSREMPTRVVNNLACCMAGLRLIDKLCASRGLTWRDMIGFEQEACAAWLQYGAREYLLDGSLTNKSVVEQTLEIMDRMGLDDTVCRITENETQVAFFINGFYDRFTKYVRDHAIVCECKTLGGFKRDLVKSDLYIITKNVRFSDDTKRAHVLNYEMLKKRCEITGFGRHGATPLYGTE